MSRTSRGFVAHHQGRPFPLSAMCLSIATVPIRQWVIDGSSAMPVPAAEGSAPDLVIAVI